MTNLNYPGSISNSGCTRSTSIWSPSCRGSRRSVTSQLRTWGTRSWPASTPRNPGRTSSPLRWPPRRETRETQGDRAGSHRQWCSNKPHNHNIKGMSRGRARLLLNHPKLRRLRKSSRSGLLVGLLRTTTRGPKRRIVQLWNLIRIWLWDSALSYKTDGATIMQRLSSLWMLRHPW